MVCPPSSPILLQAVHAALLYRRLPPLRGRIPPRDDALRQHARPPDPLPPRARGIRVHAPCAGGPQKEADCSEGWQERGAAAGRVAGQAVPHVVPRRNDGDDVREHTGR